MEILSARRQRGAPLSPRSRHLRDIDRQPRTPSINGGLDHEISQVFPSGHHRLTAEPFLDEDVAPHSPLTFHRHHYDRVPPLPTVSRHRQDQRVDPGVERGATKGHAQINTRCLPESKNLVDGPNPLRPRLAIRRLRGVFDLQLGELLKNLPHMRTYSCLSVSDEVRLRTRKTHPLRRTKQPLHPPDMNHISQPRRVVD